MTDREGRRAACIAARLAAAIALAALVAMALAGEASAAKSTTVWLCRPGHRPDPCMEGRSATVVAYSGSTRSETLEKPGRRATPKIDCFYVYPTVSEQEGPNANLEIEPQETQIAIDQASRFTQDCRVFAPMYRQLTLSAIDNPGGVTTEDEIIAYSGVLAAFDEYLHRYNKGRGFVLIGHSQGALMLENLIREQIDSDAALRSQLVSAILLGGNVLVPEGGTVGGTFSDVPACQSATEVGCVIAYSSFLKEPPEDSYFGRPGSPLLEGGHAVPGTEVLCVNPTLLTQNGSAGGLLPYAPTTPFPGSLGAASPTPSAPTPWVTSPDLYTAQCKHENGASWLQVSLAAALPEAELDELAADHDLALELIGPQWGLHLYDVNIALGNLVKTVAIQAQAYGFDG